MNRRIFRLMMSAAAMGTVLSAHAETKLLFNVFLPPSHILQAVAHEWAADVEKATGNNVKIEFTAGNMAPPPQQLQATASGIFDMALTLNAFIKSKGPLMEISSLPFLVSDPEAAGVAYWKTYQKHFANKNQYPDVQLIGLFNATGSQVFSLTDTPINSIDELKKRRMWALPGEAADLMKNVGISPITSPAVQMSESVSRGVVDGYIGVDPDAAMSFKATPYTKSITIFPLATGSAGFSLIINKGKWASLSEKDRNTIMSLGGESLARRVGKAYNAVDAVALSTLKEQGIKLVDADPVFYNALRRAGEPSYRQFEGIAAKAGLDGKAVLADFKAEYAAAIKR